MKASDSLEDGRDDGCLVEVSVETYHDLQAIARLLDCTVGAALDHVIGEYVLPHGEVAE